jgi:hypothetical protein
MAQRDLLRAQTRKTDVDTATGTASLPYAAANAAETVKQIQAQQQQLLASAQQLGEQFRLTKENADLAMQSYDFLQRLNPLLLQAKELDVQGQRYGLPELSVRSEYWRSPLSFPIYAGQQGHQAGGDVGGATATAAAIAYEASRFPRKDPRAVRIQGVSDFPTTAGESGDIGNPSP